VVVVLARVVPEPGLARLEALHDRVPGLGRVPARVLLRRRVAAADMPALRAPAQVHPPAAGGLALDAAGSARRDRLVDRLTAHLSSLFAQALIAAFAPLLARWRSLRCSLMRASPPRTRRAA